MRNHTSTFAGMTAFRALAARTAAALAATLFRYVRARATFSFSHKAVLITGGSRGLGLAMARCFAKEGARIAIVARDTAELRAAEADLCQWGAEEVYCATCDLRDRVATEAMVQAVAQRFGRIDVLINNAGIMVVGPLENQELADFEACLDLHVWAPLIITRAALPHMPKNGTGRILNISSIGGRIAPPHMAAYNTSKFAETGLSDSLGAELARKRIPVTTVLPGLMRTGSHIQALTRGRQTAEYSWFAAAATLPLFAVNATRAARKIVEGCRQGRRRVIVSWKARIAILAEALAPNLTLELLALSSRFLPPPTVESAGSPFPIGRRLEEEARTRGGAARWFAWLSERSETRNNEIRR